MSESAMSMALRGSVVALIASLLFCRAAISLGKNRDVAGKPTRRGQGRASTISHLGGVAVALAVVIALSWCSGGSAIFRSGAWQGWLLGSAWLLALGLIDDVVRELTPWIKGLGQLFAALILMGSGVRIEIAALPSVINSLLTLLWLVGMANAFNLLDIVDGLAATVAAVAALALAVAAAWAGQAPLVLLAMSLVGALAAFLMFNWSPARLYMGNSGSQWLGFTLGMLALAISYAPIGREVALATPLLVLGLPLFDLAFVVWMRLRNGRSPFHKSRDHFALRLLSTGSDARKTALAMGALAAGFAVVGLFVSRAPNRAGALAAAAMMAITLLWARRLARLPIHD